MTPSEKNQHRLRMLEHLSRTVGQAPPAPAVVEQLPIRLVGPVKRVVVPVRTGTFRRQERPQIANEQPGLRGI